MAKYTLICDRDRDCIVSFLYTHMYSIIHIHTVYSIIRNTYCVKLLNRYIIGHTDYVIFKPLSYCTDKFWAIPRFLMRPQTYRSQNLSIYFVTVKF